MYSLPMVFLSSPSSLALRLEKDTRSFALIFDYLEDKGLQRELWGGCLTNN